MSQWVMAYCTRPIGDIPLATFARALADADFSMMAEWQGLDDRAGDTAEASLRTEELPATDHRRFAVHYQHHRSGARVMPADLFVDPAFIAESIAEQLEDETLPATVKRRLPEVVEAMAFDLKASDMAGMGMPIAFYLAMWLADPKRGDGLVEVDGDWWDAGAFKRC